VFQAIPQKKQPVLQKYQDSPLEQAGGVPLNEKGIAKMELVLDRSHSPLTLKMDVTVANIKDDVLLGLDAGDTVDVVASKGQVVIDGQEVPCVRVKSSRVRCVKASERYQVPAYCEAVIEATVEGNEDGLLGEVIIEPTPTFSERHSLVMASSLVDLRRSKACKVRVMNPFEKPAVIHKRTVLGYAEPFAETLSQVAEVEDEGELGNLDSVRRIQICKASDWRCRAKCSTLVRQLVRVS